VSKPTNYWWYWRKFVACITKLAVIFKMKRVLNLIGGLFLGTALLIGGLAFLTASMQTTSKFVGRVSSDGLESFSSKTAKGFGTIKQRYNLNLEGFPLTLNWFTMNEDYSTLLKSIETGDIVTVEFLYSEIRVLTKNEKQLIGYNKIFNQNVLLGIVSLIAGIFLYWLAFRFYNKKRIPRWVMKLSK
jgi:hypothetical protein